jgi:putative oxidoreductase
MKKKIFSIQNYSSSTSLALLVGRIGIAALMLTHGIPKLLLLLSGGPVQFPPVLGLGAETSLALAVFAEVFCSLLVLAGFATRLAVLPLIATMLVAVLFIHAADPIAVKEPALQYLLAYVVLLFAGSGKYSVDSLLQDQKSKVHFNKREVQDPTFAIYQ